MRSKRERKSKRLALFGVVRGKADLATLLEVRAEDFAKVVRGAQRMYISIPFTKKDGTPRSIRAPREELKVVQRTILDVILSKIPLPRCAYGFSAGKGIIENAKLHARERYVLNMDIKDFFPSVHRTRIEQLFREMGASPEAAAVLTRLTTFKHALPQGTPSSPYLAALALDELDRRITIFCAKNRLTYSRYFDDITISGSSRVRQVKERVMGIVAECGYEVHTREDKLRLYGPGEPRLITGIEIKNGRLGFSKTGELIEYIEELRIGGMKMLRSDNPLKERMSLQGKIAFLTQVDSELGRRVAGEFEKITWKA